MLTGYEQDLLQEKITVPPPIYMSALFPAVPAALAAVFGRAPIRSKLLNPVFNHKVLLRHMLHHLS